MASLDPRPAQTSRTICLLADWFDEPYQETILRTAEDAVTQRGSSLLSFAGGIPGSQTRESQKRHAAFELIDHHNVDGAILLAGTMVNELGAEGLEALLQKLEGLPLCSIGVEVKDIPSILIDNQSGIDRALTHLVEMHGCKRIAFIRGPVKNKEAESRFTAYQEGLHRLELKRDAALVFQGDFLSASGEAAVAHWLQTRTIPDAIIAANDEMALGALSALTKAGLSVPADVRLVGFDDLEHSRLATPPITTVRQPIKDLAIAAVRTIMDQLLGRDVPRLQVLQTQLVLRESCGCSMHLSSSGQSQFPEPSVRGENSFEAAFQARLPSLRAEMARAARGEFYSLGSWEDELARAFHDTIIGSQSRFIEELSKRIGQVANAGGDVSRWHDIVTAFRRVAVSSSGSDPTLRAQCEEVLHEARLLTAQAVERAEAKKRITALRFNRTLQQSGAIIASSFSLSALSAAIQKELPPLGVSACYISAYDTPSQSDAPLPALAELVCAYDETGALGVNGGPFEARRLAPADIWPPKRLHRLTVVPLFLGDWQLGFAMLESQADGSVIEMLRASLSVALYGCSLTRRLNPST